MADEPNLRPAAWELERKKRVRQQRLEVAENRVRDRRHRLRILQDRDRQIEKRLLVEGVNEAESPESGPWFISEDMSGEKNYILQYMGTYMNKLWSKDKLQQIEQHATNMDWIKQRFPGHPVDTEALSYLTENDNLTLLRALSMSGGMMDDTSQTPLFMPDRTWDHLKAAFLLLDHLRLLRRLVDGNNPETLQKPLPDGTNLESVSLRSSWVLQRAWVRALHYRSLHLGRQDYGVKQIYHILALSLVLLDGEAARIFNGATELKNPPEFESLVSCSHNLINALNGVANDLLTESRPVEESPYTSDETLAYNLEPRRLAAIYKTNFDPVNKLWRLWAYLLCLTAEFDRRMDQEHVEDTLMSKRVVVADEFWDLSWELRGGHEPLDWSLLYGNDVEDDIYSVLRKISQVNRNRRDFLLLRDWSHRRPWRQLYYIFDTMPGAQDYFNEPINVFYEQIHKLVDLEKDPECKYKSPSPSSRANVWAQLFPIHPVSSTEPEKHSLRNCNYDGGCVICLENFEPSFVIVKLHCSHLFHYTCVRTMWDRPGVSTFACLMCRTASVKWSLHEQAGIIPEVLDVWDNEMMVGENTARRHPDTTEENDIYWIHENERLALSIGWHDVYGEQPRDVMVEMANVREARRRRNQRLRSLVPLGDSIEGLDPKRDLD